MTQILACDPNTYVANALHDSDRIWPQTNCYADLWIELLHALVLRPRAGAGLRAVERCRR